MASVFLKRGKYWARLKLGDGKWTSVPTGETDKDRALEYANEAQRSIDRKARPADVLTLAAWVDTWLPRRREAGLDWRKDTGRLTKHVLPVLGDRDIKSITTADIAGLVHDLRFKTKLAPRTVRNVNSTLTACMRDAAIAGHIATSPCQLTKIQLGSVVDKDPEWRKGALFTRDEAEQMISDPRIPLDRQVVYGFGLLAGLRPGEAAALRWRHYVPDAPLGRLTVALSYSTSYSKTKRTKTETTKTIPVHPTLAELLDLWRVGWAAMFGHEPGPEDLIVPLPPDVERRTRTGERFRGWDYSGRRWREEDLPMLGWRRRAVYDTKSTFITLAIDDGANPDVIRDRVTHTKPHRNAFDGYDRGPHWAETCREVAKLQLRRLATACYPLSQPSADTQQLGSGGGFRMPDEATISDTPSRELAETTRPLRTSCDIAAEVLAHAVARLATSGEGKE